MNTNGFVLHMILFEGAMALLGAFLALLFGLDMTKAFQTTDLAALFNQLALGVGFAAAIISVFTPAVSIMIIAIVIEIILVIIMPPSNTTSITIHCKSPDLFSRKFLFMVMCKEFVPRAKKYGYLFSFYRQNIYRSMTIY